MLDLADPLRRWTAEGRAFAVATVTAVDGSAPRDPGAALAVAADGTVVGSVSGGCVEGAVYELCREALETGEPRRARFGYADADAFAVGLTCGGSVEVLVTPVRADAPARPVLAAALDAAAQGRTAALVRVADGPPALSGALLVRPDAAPLGGLGGGAALDRTAAAEAAALLDTGRTGTVRVAADGTRCGAAQLTLLVEASVPPPRLLLFGAGDFAAALATAGTFLGHRVTVCDARPVFTTRARFPDAAEVVTDWPHRYLDGQTLDRRTAVCVLTHDPKFDIPLLTRALARPFAYVGAMGSRRTHDDRLRRLREAGVTEARLARLRSPLGLDLGARTPQETALSIAAEIVALRRGGSGGFLTGTDLPIHPAAGPVSCGHDVTQGADPARPQPRAA
ncbi:XdhC family protein [Streptomyces avicenniae]|uniref:XdhC family protein n=1 Tax=Streptomyces avicenniae TaxID=500153 RepID=UPI00069C1E39|nr:XdhC/CoxI family protein [Streptomyces avicenniae]